MKGTVLVVGLAKYVGFAVDAVSMGGPQKGFAVFSLEEALPSADELRL